MLAGKVAAVTGASKGIGAAISKVLAAEDAAVALVTPPGIAVYNATKGAVDAVKRSFAREPAGRNIRVNAVNPGLIATEGTHSAGFVSDSAPSPLGRAGKPEDIASIVTFLATDDSRWINGQIHYATGDLL